MKSPKQPYNFGCEKMKLVRAVEALSKELNRPVCSKDLKAYFFQNPEKTPILRQFLSQQLLKATRRWSASVPILFQIGMIENRAYYAASDDLEWTQKLKCYSLSCSIQREIKLNMISKAISLVESPHEKFALNALAGWIQEWEPAIKFTSPEKREILEEMIEEAGKYASPKFIRRVPRRLLNRNQAMKFLKDETIKRVGKFRTSHVNHTRYLAHWNWPQSKLFPTSGKLLYVSEQLRLIAQKTWSTFEEDPYLAEAILVCSRYGFAYFPSGSTDR